MDMKIEKKNKSLTDKKVVINQPMHNVTLSTEITEAIYYI